MIIKKIIMCILIVMLINSVFATNTFAISDIIESGSRFVKRGEQGDKVISEGTLKNTNSKIYNILLGVRNCCSSYCWSNFRSDIYFI